jgi:hypothetical protein
VAPVSEPLHASHADERREHEEAIERLRVATVWLAAWAAT